MHTTSVKYKISCFLICFLCIFLPLNHYAQPQKNIFLDWEFKQNNIKIDGKLYDFLSFQAINKTICLGSLAANIILEDTLYVDLSQEEQLFFNDYDIEEHILIEHRLGLNRGKTCVSFNIIPIRIIKGKTFTS